MDALHDSPVAKAACGTSAPAGGCRSMNETLKRIGLELRRRYHSMLRLPMNWRMIDAIVRLEETEERKARNEGQAAFGDAPPPEGKVVDLQRREG